MSGLKLPGSISKIKKIFLKKMDFMFQFHKQQPADKTERTFSHFLFWIIGLKYAGFFLFFLVPFYLHHSHNNKMFKLLCLHPEINSYFSTGPFKKTVFSGSTYFYLSFKNLLQNYFCREDLISN